MSKINTQKIKEAPAKALELSPKIIIFGLIGLTFMAWFYETMKPEQMAEAGELPIMEDRYSPPPKPETPLGVGEVEAEPKSKPSKPFLTDEAKQKMAERIDAFSLEVGSPLRSDYGMVWVEAGIKYDRHPYSLVAIALADTSLGKQLTTPFNLGNVANSDSCPTCGNHITSWEQGIDEIGKTLANRYLGKATKLCHLSRGGWNVCPEGAKINGGKFYASSLENWNRNSIWAESWMHGTEWRADHSIILSDYYQFSIG
jgi:hypothetical protein